MLHLEGGSAISTPWYASFAVQGPAATALLQELPAGHPPRLPRFPSVRAVWAFFGAPGPGGMAGKAEHVDALRDGVTVHRQILGQKSWSLRPNPLGDWGVDGPPIVAAAGSRLRVTCSEGDMLVVDTGRWYHETELLAGESGFSLSVATDLAEAAGELEIAEQTTVLVQFCSICATPASGTPCQCRCCCFSREVARGLRCALKSGPMARKLPGIEEALRWHQWLQRRAAQPPAPTSRFLRVPVALLDASYPGRGKPISISALAD